MATINAWNSNLPAEVAKGGTGNATNTIHGVMIGNAGNALNVTTAGTTGQVLTGVTGADPTFQSPAASSISITGNTGGALTGNSFTFSGGTTGLSFGGSGTTETLSGTVVIANGGTNATSMSTSTGIVKFDGTRLVTSSTAKIDSSNRYTNTSQPAFNFQVVNGGLNNVTGDGTLYTIVFNTSVFDQNSNFDGTSTFIAPVTGIYYFLSAINIFGADTLTTSGSLRLATTQHSYIQNFTRPFIVAGTGNLGMSISALTPMTAGDTAKVQIGVGGTNKAVSIYNDSSFLYSFFSGYLVC